MISRWHKIALRLLLATTGVTGSAVADRDRPAIPLDGIAATVNQQIITMGDVREMMAPVALQLQQHYHGRELDQRLGEAYRRTLTNLIHRALILDAYAAGDNQIPDRLLEARVREITFDQFGDDREAFWRRLDDAGLTLEVWQQQVRESIVVSLLHDAEVENRVVVPPGVIRAAYDSGIDRYQVPEQVHLGVIVIRDAEDNQGHSELRELAESLVTRLRDGASFEQLARNYSQGRQADAGGDWGWMEMAELRPELAEPARQLAVDAISGVITIDRHHYILHIQGRRHEQIIPLHEVYEELHRELRRQAADRIYDRWITRLADWATVQVREDGMQ